MFAKLRHGEVQIRSTARVIDPVHIVPILLLLSQLVPVSSESCPADSLDCVCSYEFLKVDLRETVLTSSPYDLVDHLKTYSCQQFRSLPTVLNTKKTSSIMSPQQANSFPMSPYDNNPVPEEQEEFQGPHFGTHNAPPYSDFYHLTRSLKRRRRQISNMDQAQRARLETAISEHGSEDSALHSYAFLGHRIQMSCSAEEESSVSAGVPFNSKLEWFHSNGDPISAPAATVHPQTGELTILSAQLSDIDSYNCSITAPTGQRTNVTHQLSIVTDSIHWLSTKSTFDTPSCSLPEMRELQSSLSSWVTDYICPVCTVHDSSVSCDSPQSGGVQFRSNSEYEIRFALTAFNFEAEIDTRLDLGLCPELCLQALHLLLLNIMKDSLQKLLSRPIQVTNGNTLYPRPERMGFELMTGCLAGFEFQSKICFPCRPGHYSVRGESDCVKCSHGSYQSSAAASKCIPCPPGKDTIESGEVSSSACLPSNMVEAYHSLDDNPSSAIVILIMMSILLLILIALAVICCCFPNSKVGRGLRACCCCLCRLCKGREGESGKPRRLSKRSLKRSGQELDDELNLLSHQSGSKESSKSWKKLAHNKLPHMWGPGSKNKKSRSEYKHLHEETSEDSSEEEQQRRPEPGPALGDGDDDEVYARRRSLSQESDSRHPSREVQEIRTNHKRRDSHRKSSELGGGDDDKVYARRRSLSQESDSRHPSREVQEISTNHKRRDSHRKSSEVKSRMGRPAEYPSRSNAAVQTVAELRKHNRDCIEKGTSNAPGCRKGSLADDQVLSKVRVRDTVAKIDAVARFSKMTSKANNTSKPERSSFTTEPGLCERGRNSRGQDEATLTSADECHTGRPDYYCHRCIKPSLKQPRFMPPPPPPHPPNSRF